MPVCTPLHYPRYTEERLGVPSTEWDAGPAHGLGIWLTDCDRFMLARFKGTWRLGPNYDRGNDVVDAVTEWLDEIGIEDAEFASLRDAVDALEAELAQHPCSA